ncbi:hypothetical protein ACFLSJ_05230 [Verrucomicrobiota bacterium]
MQSPPLKLIVIHGWGGTLEQAVDTVASLFDFESRWRNGSFEVERRTGVALRRALEIPKPDRTIRAFQKLVLSRLLSSPGAAKAEQGDDPASHDRYVRFAEQRLSRDFAAFGLPSMPGARHRRAEQLQDEALTDLEPVSGSIDTIHHALLEESAGGLTEADTRELIRRHSKSGSADEGLVRLLETLRDTYETGGDLDTVASAVLYAHWIVSEALKAGRAAAYGRDFRFVFLNYHESLKPLAEYAPAEVYAADLPMGAFPEFPEDVRYLHKRGVHVARYEDHHPCSERQRDALRKLAEDGCLGFFEMSGPLPGEELDTKDLRCGADMVYENTVEGKPWDCEGARSLRRAAHSEDFVRDQGELGRLLTELIKGGICKAELAQLLLESIPGGDAAERLHGRRWDTLAASWRARLGEIEAPLRENVVVLGLPRPKVSPAEQGGQALGMGSDVPASPGPKPTRDDDVTVLMALAPSPEPGKQRITTGKASEFYARTFPGVDYLFYCFGASLMVVRRLNQADLTFNLGTLMPRLGGPGDGGHTAAAVCRPEQSPAYPLRLLPNVNAGNFKRFAGYMAFRLKAMGYPVSTIRDRSVRTSADFRRGGRKLLIVTALALVVGLLLVLSHPAFRPGAVRRSNDGFFPQITLGEDAPTPYEDETGDP